MKIRLQILAILIAVTLLLFFVNFKLEKTKVLIIESETENIKHTIKIPQKKFTLSYIHSVQKTPVYEVFEIDEDNKLILKETTFSSLGVGLPFTEENGVFRNEQGKFKLTGLNREFTSIAIRVSPIPKHTIIIGENTHPLLSIVAPDDLVKIAAADRWMLVRRNNFTWKGLSEKNDGYQR
ncbi:MAG TPA: DUF1850 domain-containing protein [Thermoanaerobacterales bacterium]|jgi:hypothetical protein|nr:DUF1850 domain-containing protein [Thermoanaerobacterales bacterium]